MVDLKSFEKKFENFAVNECAGSSELYEYLSLNITQDKELLELASYVQNNQPVPNLLFGAVHYLLLTGIEHELKHFYPSIVAHPKRHQESFPYFKNFCKLHREAIIPILKEKLVQTNEVRRCAYLFPIFSLIYEKTKKPLACIEIGTSAGLQLLWDKYSYSYQSDVIYGNLNSNVHITAEMKGKYQPNLPTKPSPVSHRFGLDLHINDLANAEDALWMNALIWPEHDERRTLFKQACSTVLDNREELHFIEGDGVELLPNLVEGISEQSTLCVFHTHVANQMPEQLKHKLINNVKEIAESRDIFHIYNNMWDLDLHLDYFVDGVEYNKTLAKTDGHGRWFEWKLY